MIKKNTTFLALIIATIVGIQACNNNDKKSAETADTTLQDTTEKAAPIVSSKPFHQPVDFKLANECLATYVRYPTNTASIRTTSVSFGTNTLIKWMENLKDSTDFDSVRVSFGLYTPEILKHYHKPDSLKNRLTVFLYLFNKGKNAIYHKKLKKDKLDSPIFVPPFNLGDIHPPK